MSASSLARMLISVAALALTTTALAGPLRVGVAKAKLTPDKPGQWIAGYGENRPAEGVHDDVWTRAMAIGDGETTIVIVANDLVGLFYPDTREIAGSVPGVPADNVIITCTHVHSGPDVLGLWGPNRMTRGVDEAYLAMVKRRIAATIGEALANTQPAKLRFARAEAPPKTGYNCRERELVDPEISVMQAVTADGKAVGTLVNYACHPEVLRTDSRLITSDWVHYLREEMEPTGTGDVLLVNGALGGMVTPEIDAPTFAEAERVGRALGKAALEGLKTTEEISEADIGFERATFDLAFDNPGLALLAQLGVIHRTPSAQNTVQTSVIAARIGPAQFASLPGEALPKVGLAVKGLMTAKYRFFFGLCDDELGYLLHAEALDNPLYKYEQSMSANPQAVPLLMEQVKAAVEATE
ncbi:MAG: hypothetical protein FJX75_13190 [Armatimonadetes bacterium]|nr:hypothetical protein [Armatimonadota bacterium]